MKILLTILICFITVSLSAEDKKTVNLHFSDFKRLIDNGKILEINSEQYNSYSA